MSDLFLIIKDTDFASYANDNAIYKVCNCIRHDVIAYLQQSSEKLFKWFSDNQMKGNTNKWHLILSFNDSNEVKIGNSLIKRSNCEQLLGVKIDTKFTFDDHIKEQWRKANSKVGALGRVTQYMGLAKTNLLLNSFFAP